MRTILNISLPEETAQMVRKTAKKEGFASTSEFFRHLVREYRRTQLVEELRGQRKEFERDKGKTLRSLHDLQ